MKKTANTIWFHIPFLILALVIVFGIPTARADGTPGQGVDDFPDKIYMAVGILDVDNVDAADQNFTSNVMFSGRWIDKRLAHEGPGTITRPLGEIWDPRIQVLNQQKIFTTLDPIASIKPNGEVQVLQRVWGDFSQPMDLHDFPFDTQAFEIRLVSVESQYREIELVTDPQFPSRIASAFSVADWEIVSFEAKSINAPVFEGGREISNFSFKFLAKRKSRYYIMKVIIPLILIVAMSWMVFWLDPVQAGPQIGVATTSMLTLIAYRFMVGGLLPKVSYMTRMDIFILSSTLIVFLTLMEASLTSVFADRGKIDMARRVDNWCRVIFPSAFLLILYFSFKV